MNIIKVYDLAYDRYVQYAIPTKKEAIKHMENTWGSQWDSVEKEMVEGGIPTPWRKVI